MQTSTIVVLMCVVAMVAARATPESQAMDAVHIPDDAVYEAGNDTPVHERSSRTKRGLLLLKKKLLLGALGLKAAKVGAVGAGVAALAYKKTQSVHPPRHVPTLTHYGYSSHGPSWNVEVHSWH